MRIIPWIVAGVLVMAFLVMLGQNAGSGQKVLEIGGKTLGLFAIFGFVAVVIIGLGSATSRRR